MDRRQALRWTGIGFTIVGAVLLAWSLAEGQARIDLFLILPVIHGEGVIVAAAFLMFFLGMLLFFLSLSLGMGHRTEDDHSPPEKREWGGVILLGPIPIVLGSSGFLKERRVLVILGLLSTLLLILFLFTVLR